MEPKPDRAFPDLRQSKRGKRRNRKPGDPHQLRTTDVDHPWRYKHKAVRPSRDMPYNQAHKRWAGIHWESGEMIPNTLETWVRSAIKGKRGVVLCYRKTCQLAELLGIPVNPTAEPVEDESAHRPVADGEVAGSADLVDSDPALLEGADGVLADSYGDLGSDLDADE